jgi:hypothetical protein
MAWRKVEPRANESAGPLLAARSNVANALAQERTGNGQPASGKVSSRAGMARLGSLKSRKVGVSWRKHCFAPAEANSRQQRDPIDTEILLNRRDGGPTGRNSAPKGGGSPS